MDSLLRKNMEKKTRSATVQQERCHFLLSPKSFASIRKTPKKVVPLGYRSGKNSCRRNFHVHNYLWLGPFFSQTFKGKVDGEKSKSLKTVLSSIESHPISLFQSSKPSNPIPNNQKNACWWLQSIFFSLPPFCVRDSPWMGESLHFKRSSQKKRSSMAHQPLFPPLTYPPKKIMVFIRPYVSGFPNGIGWPPAINLAVKESQVVGIHPFTSVLCLPANWRNTSEGKWWNGSTLHWIRERKQNVDVYYILYACII